MRPLRRPAACLDLRAICGLLPCSVANTGHKRIRELWDSQPCIRGFGLAALIGKGLPKAIERQKALASQAKPFASQDVLPIWFMFGIFFLPCP